ncbi:BatD family protein [Rhizobium sp. CFBP 13717]|nr:BatD family protein [Rhizobium sp. CFBP 13644]MBD8687220.1 BatD family protein [Rhizobium sp. CFBP 13644]MBD8690977.1 BatD family protein [Rhizobium sp. CFBP 13717]
MLVIIVGFLTCGQVIAAVPFARASIDRADRIVPGEEVHVVVEVYAPGFFTTPPQFLLFEVPDALVTLSEDRAQNVVETIEGVQYSGIRKTYAVVPEKRGSFALPEIGIDLGFSSDGTTTRATVRVGLPSFDVVAASGQSGTPFAARGLMLSQSFDRDPASLKAGDALVRTIVVFASNTQAMLIPPVDFGEAAGTARYVKPPVLTDGVERRGIGRSVDTGSTRTETVVYTTTTEGRFSLPPITYPWFDIEGRELTIATLPAVALVVQQAATGEGIAPVLDQEPRSSRWTTRGLLAVLLIVAIDLALAVFAWRRYPTIRLTAKTYLGQRRNSPRRRLRRLRALVRTGSDDAVYQALHDWSLRLGYGTISAWTSTPTDPALAAQVAILERRLFSSCDVELDRRALASAIVLPTPPGERSRNALPELNPSANHPLLPPLLQ